jgi:hypothetical protein
MANSHERQHRRRENFRTITRAPTSRIDESFENSFGSRNGHKIHCVHVHV